MKQGRAGQGGVVLSGVGYVNGLREGGETREEGERRGRLCRDHGRSRLRCCGKVARVTWETQDARGGGHGTLRHGKTEQRSGSVGRGGQDQWQGKGKEGKLMNARYMREQHVNVAHGVHLVGR